jgi:hypothetical protein
VSVEQSIQRYEDETARDLGLVRAAIRKPWNSPGELSTILAEKALDRLAYKLGAVQDAELIGHAQDAVDALGASEA